MLTLGFMLLILTIDKSYLVYSFLLWTVDQFN